MEIEPKEKIIARLKSIEGHVRGVQRMVEADEYCIDIVKQTMAIQSALDKFNSVILRRHMDSCVTTAIQGQDAGERERVISELLEVFEASGKL